MDIMDMLGSLFKEYGLLGLIVIVLVYIILKSKFRIEYPRRDRKQG